MAFCRELFLFFVQSFIGRQSSLSSTSVQCYIFIIRILRQGTSKYNK